MQEQEPYTKSNLKCEQYRRIAIKILQTKQLRKWARNDRIIFRERVKKKATCTQNNLYNVYQNVWLKKGLHTQYSQNVYGDVWRKKNEKNHEPRSVRVVQKPTHNCTFRDHTRTDPTPIHEAHAHSLGSLFRADGSARPLVHHVHHQLRCLAGAR